MPRYYKNKIWTKEQLALISENQTAQMQTNYALECEDLRRTGVEDPDLYIQMNRIYQANQVMKKAREGNTF